MTYKVSSTKKVTYIHTLDEQILHIRETEIHTNPRSIMVLHLHTALWITHLKCDY